MLFLCLPIIVFMEPILNIWLVEVPKYTVILSQYTLICQLTGVFNVSLYTAMTASGRLKENSIASIFVTILGVLGLYFMFKSGWDVIWVQYMALFQSVVYSFIVKPAILCKYVPDYTWKEIMLCTWQMIKTSFVPLITSILIYRFFIPKSIIMMIFDCMIIMLSVCISSFAFMDKVMRTKLINLVKNRFQKK